MKINQNEGIIIKEQISARTESDYLIISNKKICEELLKNSELNDENIIDIFISLHMVLEVSLNALYRHIALLGIKKDVDKFEIIKNIDGINFIDKTTLFIYNSKFNFERKLSEATRYHSIINTIKDFASIRNKLLHGHSISTIFDGEKNRHSDLKKSINLEKLKDQVRKFCFILEGMKFYLDCLESSLTKSGKEGLKKSYLDDSFLPHLR